MNLPPSENQLFFNFFYYSRKTMPTRGMKMSCQNIGQACSYISQIQKKRADEPKFSKFGDVLQVVDYQ